MKLIDTHIHADARSSEDFEKMFISGIDTAITCAFYPYELMSEIVLLNHLEKFNKISFIANYFSFLLIIHYIFINK